MLKLFETATQVLVEATPGECAALVEEFQFRAPGYFYAPSYERWLASNGKEGWDGYLRPVRRIAAGACKAGRGRRDDIIRWAEQNGYELDLEKLLPKPFAHLTIDDIEPDLIAGDFKLDDFQRQSVLRWLQNGIGVIQAVVASGKTATFAAAAALIKRHYPNRAILYITPSERLVRQSTREMKRMLPDFEVGQFGGGHFQHGAKDMVVCTTAMLYKHFLALEANGFFRRFIGVFVDECVTGDTRLTVADGTQIRLDVAVQHLHVKTFNEATGCIEVKKARCLFRGVRKTVRVATDDGQSIRCTEEHPFLTNHGWIMAKNLVLGDVVYKYAEPGTDAVGLRQPFGGRQYEHQRQVYTPKILHSPQRQSGRSGFGQIRASERLHQNSAKSGGERRLGRPDYGLYNFNFPGFRQVVLALLSSWEQTNFCGVAVVDCAEGSRLVVYGRRLETTYWRSSFYREFYTAGKLRFTALAAWNLGSLAESHSLSTKSMVSSFWQASGGIFLFADFPVRFARDALQALSASVVNLCFLWSRIFTPPTAKFSLFFGCLPKSGPKTADAAVLFAEPNSYPGATGGKAKTAAQQDVCRLWPALSNQSATPKALQQPGVCCGNAPVLQPVRIESVSDTGKMEEVFDLSVDDNHNFFGNGLLVHNCHHAGAKSFQKVLEAVPAYFRFGASDTTKEEDERRWNAIRGLLGPTLNVVKAKPLMDVGRIAAPHIYIVDVKGWNNKYHLVSYRPAPGSRAFVLVDDQWKIGKYLGPVYETDEEGEVLTRRVKTAVKDDNNEWIVEEQPVILTGMHRVEIDGREFEMPSKWCLLDRAYDRAIIQFQERNAAIVRWAAHYSAKGYPTVVVCTRTLHVYILEALLKKAVRPELVDILIGKDTPVQRDDCFDWFRNTPGAVLVTPLVREGVSIWEIRAGIVADYLADHEVARQIIGRFIRKKLTADNRAEITFFRDRQHPVLRRGCNTVFRRLVELEGYHFYDPAPDDPAKLGEQAELRLETGRRTGG